MVSRAKLSEEDAFYIMELAAARREFEEKAREAEREVAYFKMRARALSNRAIARKLEVSEYVVHRHSRA